MNAERLLNHYERIADAPDAIARLRRFILDLAVRGKLVPQNLNDEPVSLTLLRREPDRKQPTGRTGADLGSVTLQEVPVEVPTEWRWSRLFQLCVSDAPIVYGILQPGPDTRPEGVPYIRPSEIENGRVVLADIRHTTKEIAKRYSRASVRPGDLILTIVGTIGAVAVVPDELDGGNITQSSCRLRIDTRLINSAFLLHALRSNCVEDQINRMKLGTAVPRLNIAHVRAIAIPLPSLAEQHRIVTKVDELMALCDRLESARAKRAATRDRLAAATLARLNVPDSNPTIFADHVRFALGTLPALTARSVQIKQFRQTILNLAVRGKLVPQEPKDEVAAELLERIAKAKADRKKETGDARIKMEPNPKPDQLAMSLPRGWAVQSFENLFLFIDYRGNTPPKTDDGIPLITAKNIRMGYLNREPREYISKATFKTWMTRGFPKVGDLFFTTEAPLANICLNDIEAPFALAQRAICFQPYTKIDTKFLMFALMSDVMQSLIDKHATGMTAKGIKAANLKPLPIPIPPLAEQHRIVAKVDELMALCDRLEASLATGDDARRRLLAVLLAEALAPAKATAMEAVA